MSNPNFNTLAATTIKNYRKTLTDNIFNTHPLLFWLKDKKRVRFEDGGTSIVEHLLYTRGDTPKAGITPGATYGSADVISKTDGSYAEWDAIRLTPVQTATAAEFDWKYLAGSVSISGPEELKNSGKERMINLLEAKIMQAEETMKEDLSAMIFKSTAAGSGVTGLGVLIGDHTDTVTTVGGINCATAGNEYWRSVKKDLTATLAANLDLRKEIRKAYNTASKNGPDRVDLVLSGQGAYEQYEEDLLPSIRRTNTKMADAGFTNLEVQGVPWTWDPECPSGTIYGINSKYLGIVGHKNRWFKQSAFTDGLEHATSVQGGTATVVDARHAVITAALETTVRNRRRMFKLVGLNLRP